MKKDLLLSVVITVFTLFFITNCNNVKKQSVEEEDGEGAIHEVAEELPVNLEYGLPVDSFIIEKKKVKRNQNLSNILIPYGISPKTIDLIAHKKMSLMFAKYGRDIFINCFSRKIRQNNCNTLCMSIL
jgi:hypothetical protein